MKTIKQLILSASLTGGLLISAVVRADNATNAPAPTAPATNAVAAPAAAVTNAAVTAAPATNQAPTVVVTVVVSNAPPQTTAPAIVTPAATPEQPVVVQATPATNQPSAAPTPPAASDQPAASPVADSNTVSATAADKGLRLNFRGVPLEMVLNYMSDAAGFIIVLDTEVKGKVDVWSNQPLSKEEAVDLLKVMLNKNGYTAIQDGRTLTIVRSDEAKKKDIPVTFGNNPDRIPRNADIVTQIIPVRSLNAVQLAKDLAPLLSSDTTLTPNESGNSLIMTDTQTNIRRITEIIKALDSVNSSINTIRVFTLKYADAKTLVTTIKDLFPTADASRTGNNGGGNNGGFGRFRGGGFGGFPGGGGGGGGDNSGSDANNGKTPSTRVSATADDHSNSLIVSAPEDVMPTIEALVASVDTSVEDITEVRVFRLKNADPGEMADLLGNLFPDDSSSTGSGRYANQFAFGGFRGPFAQPVNNTSASADNSDRMKRLGKVIAVADRRTASVVVSSSKDLMPQIAAMVEQLDARPDHKQKVFVYSLENADVQDVQQVLQDLFQSGSSRSAGSTGNQNSNPLTTRSQSIQQQQNSSSGSSGGFGTSFGGNTTGKGF